MAEKSILFSTEMVKAILDGKKSVTRRVVKPQPPTDTTLIWGPEWYETSVIGKDGELKPGALVYGISDDDGEWGIKCPYPPGTVLWVRETWADLRGMGFGNDPRTDKPWNFAYAADVKPGSDSDQCRKEYGVKWEPSSRMPRLAARLFLRVTNVRVERLQEITRADVLAEGVEQLDSYHEAIDHAFAIGGGTGDIPRQIFRQLWNSLNDKRGFGWDSNCWVWVVEFSVVNADAK